jgi:hypothetical protein
MWQEPCLEDCKERGRVVSALDVVPVDKPFEAAKRED